MDMAQELGKQIKAAREAKGWTQADLATRCAVGKAQISKLEQTITHASMGLFLKVCEVVGYTPRLLDAAGESRKKLCMTYWDILESATGDNVQKYMVALSQLGQELPNVDRGKALDSVVKFILSGLRLEYSLGMHGYDYHFSIGHKKFLLSWKIGNLNNEGYRNNVLSEVISALSETHAHKFIVTIPDYQPIPEMPEIPEEMNNVRLRENLVFVPINSLSTYLQDLLERGKS